jgi:hypothetical protein
MRRYLPTAIIWRVLTLALSNTCLGLRAICLLLPPKSVRFDDSQVLQTSRSMVR